MLISRMKRHNALSDGSVLLNFRNWVCPNEASLNLCKIYLFSGKCLAFLYMVIIINFYLPNLDWEVRLYFLGFIYHKTGDRPILKFSENFGMIRPDI